jgi:hypothetical protein
MVGVKILIKLLMFRGICSMTNTPVVIGSFITQTEAENTVNRLINSGIDPNKISIVCKNRKKAENVNELSIWKKLIREDAEQGLYQVDLLEGLLAPFPTVGLLFTRGAGSMIVLGHLSEHLHRLITQPTRGNVRTEVLDSLTSILASIGVPEREALRYETRVRGGMILVFVSGTEAEVNSAQQNLQNRQLSVAAGVAAIAR